MNEETGRSGSLEKRGIPVETTIDENVLTESTAKAVRFRAAQVPNSSKTYGYVFNEVDKFVEDIVIPSLAWYQTALHERDKTVHYLGDELDKAETDNLNLRNQIQYIEYNGQIKQGIQAGSDDKEMAALMQRLQDSNSQVESLRAQLAANGVEVDTSVSPSALSNIAEYETAIAERDAYIEQVTAQYNELYEQYQTDMAGLQEQIDNAGTTGEDTSELVALRDARIAELEAELANVPAIVPATEEAPDNSAHVAELEAYIEQVTAQYNELYTQYQTDTAALQAKVDELEALKTNVAEVTAGNPDADARIAELEAYIEQVTAQYNELYQRYEADIVNVPASSDDNGSAEQVTELNAYIEQITAQYNALYAQYLELEANQVPSTNNAELGALKVELESEKAKVSRLEAELAQYQDEEEEEEEKKPRIPLLTEQKDRTPTNLPKNVDVNKLPEGIRPDDLF
jgi:hypothetical protein